MDSARKHSANRRVSNGPLVAIGLAIVAVLAEIFLPANQDYSNADLVATGLIALTFGTVVIRYYQSGRDLLDPLVVFSASIGFYFGLHTLWEATPSHFELVERHIHPVFAPFIPSSLALLAAGYVALLIGFFSHRRRLPTVKAARMYSPVALATVFGVGMAMNLVYTASGGFKKEYQNTGVITSNLQTYKTLAFISTVALVVCACQHYQQGGGRSRYRGLMWAMLVIQIAFAFAVAEKSLAFGAVFAWAAARNYSGSRVRFKPVAIMALIALFVVSPIIQSTRSHEQAAQLGDQGNVSSAGATVTSVPQHISNYVREFPDSAFEGWNIVNRRTDGAESLALAVHYTPIYKNWLYGRHFLAILAAPIPHEIWPSKPTWNASLYFSEVYAQETQAEGFGLTYAPTVPADFYMNFGAVGVIGGMFAIGIGLWMIANVLTRFPGSPGIAIYVATMLAVVFVERDTTGISIVAILQLGAVGITFGLLRLMSGHALSRRYAGGSSALASVGDGTS